MVDEDVLDKALDVIDRNDKEGYPTETDAIVTDIEVTTRENIFGSGSKWGNDDDPFMNVFFDVVYGGSVIESGRKPIPITTGRNSQLAKYNRKYGRPEVGQEIKVFLPKESDFWDIDLSRRQ